jgi:hypothetical protein
VVQPQVDDEHHPPSALDGEDFFRLAAAPVIVIAIVIVVVVLVVVARCDDDGIAAGGALPKNDPSLIMSDGAPCRTLPSKLRCFPRLGHDTNPSALNADVAGGPLQSPSPKYRPVAASSTLLDRTTAGAPRSVR